MMGPSLSGGSGGTSFTTIRDRVLKHKTTSADYYALTASGSFSNARQQILDIFRGSFAASADEAARITPDSLILEIATCSGGGGCGYGGTSCHGGFPGIVKKVRCLLADLPEGQISYVVGAGGSPGQWSGNTYFGQLGSAPNFNPWYCYSPNAARGGNSHDEHNMLHETSVSLGMDPSTVRRGILPTTSSFWTAQDRPTNDRFSAANGPGGGGSSASYLGYGGHGSMSAPSGARPGGVPGGTKNGGAHVSTDYHSYGGGGAGNGAGSGGGNGGFPGGGGGSHTGDPTGAGWGYGAAGIIKIRGINREIVK